MWKDEERSYLRVLPFFCIQVMVISTGSRFSADDSGVELAGWVQGWGVENPGGICQPLEGAEAKNTRIQ
jgi:hypothetical protein